MKIKRILAFLAGMLIAISAFWITNQSEQVSASVFQKTTVPKKFRGTWYSCWGNGKVQPFKITRTEINLAGCADGGQESTNILNEHIMPKAVRTY